MLEEQRLQPYGFDYIFYRHKGHLLGTIFEEEGSHFPILGYGFKKNGIDSSPLRFVVPLKFKAFSFTCVPAVTGCLQCGNYKASVSSTRSTDNQTRQLQAIWKVFTQPSI